VQFYSGLGIITGMSTLVVPHDLAWAEAFAREAEAISRAFSDHDLVIHHIGSTAIPGILAKPIIDMLGVVQNLETMDRYSGKMQVLGYEVMGSLGIEGRRYFRKSDLDGRRTHHLHVFALGSPHVERHLAFREYLRSHSSKAAEYSDLKAQITSTGAVSRDVYRNAKEPFVVATERLAVDWYRQETKGH
jgi:GrpB-like predicted nucleotidyltransferase (UPF0157 family)